MATNLNGYKIINGNPAHVDVRGLRVDYTKNRAGVKPSREEVADLIATLPVRGMDTPVWVRRAKIEKDEVLDVIAGFRRCAALEYANEGRDEGSQILAAFIIKTCSAEEAMILNIAENEQRAGFTDVERALTIKRLQDTQGKTDDEVAAIFGKSPAWVYLRKKIITLPKWIQDLGQHGQVKGNFLFTVADVPEEQQKALVEQAQVEARAEVEANGGVIPEEVRMVPMTEAHLKKAAKKTGVKTSGGAKPKAIKDLCETQDGPGNSQPVRKIYRALKAWVEGQIDEDKFHEILVRNAKVTS